MGRAWGPHGDAKKSLGRCPALERAIAALPLLQLSATVHGVAKPWDTLEVPEGTILEWVGSRKGKLGVHSTEMGTSIPLPTRQPTVSSSWVWGDPATATAKQRLSPWHGLDPPQQRESPVSCKHSRGGVPALSPSPALAVLALGCGSSSGAGLVRHAVSAAAQPPAPPWSPEERPSTVRPLGRDRENKNIYH